MQTAIQQSSNIIIDLHRSRMPEERAIKDFVREFNGTKGARRLKIIKKNREILDFMK